jgi:hypothetical protein
VSSGIKSSSLNHFLTADGYVSRCPISIAEFILSLETFHQKPILRFTNQTRPDP